MTELTLKQVLAFNPCIRDQVIERFAESKALTARQAFDAGFSVFDLCWLAGKLGEKEKLAMFAAKCADSVKHLKKPASAYAADAANAYADAYATAVAAAFAAANADAAYATAYETQVKLNKSFFVGVFDA